MAELVDYCKKCGGESLVLKVRIVGNGYKHVGQYCVSCKGWANPAIYIPHEQVAGMGMDAQSLPVVEDLRKKYGGRQCSIMGCRDRSTELHHMAPRQYFGDDCEKWPKLYLCPRHHRLWHSSIKLMLYIELRRERVNAKYRV